MRKGKFSGVMHAVQLAAEREASAISLYKPYFTAPQTRMITFFLTSEYPYRLTRAGEMLRFQRLTPNDTNACVIL